MRGFRTKWLKFFEIFSDLKKPPWGPPCIGSEWKPRSALRDTDVERMDGSESIWEPAASPDPGMAAADGASDAITDRAPSPCV